MAKKRGQNEGSIRKRKDGTWEARVTIGILENGKQNRKSLYGKTRQEVSAKMTDLLNNLQKGVITNPTEMTVSEWLDIYINSYLKPDFLFFLFLILFNCIVLFDSYHSFGFI